MKLFINFTLILFCSLSTHAQVVSESLDNFAISEVRWIPVNSSSFESRGNKSFLFEEGIFANVILDGGQVIEYQKIRYDLAGQMMHFFIDGKIKALHRNGIKSFIIVDPGSERVREFRNADEFADTDYQHGFFEVLADGSTKLLKGYYVKPEPISTLITLGGSDSNTNRFDIIPIVYLQIDQKAIKLPLGKRAILSLFDESEDEMTSFIKENRLKIKRTEDLIRIIQYYNQIQ